MVIVLFVDAGSFYSKYLQRLPSLSYRNLSTGTVYAQRWQVVMMSFWSPYYAFCSNM